MNIGDDWLKQCEYTVIDKEPNSIHNTINRFITMSAQASDESGRDVYRHIENHKRKYEETHGVQFTKYASIVALYHMAEELEIHHKSRNKAEQRLAEELEIHHKSRNKAEQRLAEVSSMLENERMARLEAEQQLAGMIDQGIESKIQDFISSHIVACHGNFLPTQAINAAYIMERGDASITCNYTFQRELKKWIMQSFSDISGFSYNRSLCNGKQLRGYAGLRLK